MRGYVDATRDANLPFRVPRLGVNAELTQYLDSQLPDQLDLMRAAHVTWVRQSFRWDEIEPEQACSPGSVGMPWSRRSRAIRPEAGSVLVNTPTWARDSAASSASGPPSDPADSWRSRAPLPDATAAPSTSISFGMSQI